MQWNKRGVRFSVPKPVAGASNPKRVKGGGKGGWGNGLMLTEDQKEYVKAVEEKGRMDRRERDLLDRDWVLGIEGGERQRRGGKVKVGAGRDINSRRR